MSSSSWVDLLAAALARRPRVAVLGIGHELAGDDAAGLLVARALAARPLPGGATLVLDAGSAPENFTGALRRFQPQLVLLIDAAQMDETPGTVRWLAWQDTEGISASTHTLPLHMLASYLTAELGCGVALIGIQPAANEFGAPPTSEVQRAVEEVSGALERSLFEL